MWFLFIHCNVVLSIYQIAGIFDMAITQLSERALCPSEYQRAWEEFPDSTTACESPELLS